VKFSKGKSVQGLENHEKDEGKKMGFKGNLKIEQRGKCFEGKTKLETKGLQIKGKVSFEEDRRRKGKSSVSLGHA